MYADVSLGTVSFDGIEEVGQEHVKGDEEEQMPPLLPLPPLIPCRFQFIHVIVALFW